MPEPLSIEVEFNGAESEMLAQAMQVLGMGTYAEVVCAMTLEAVNRLLASA